MVVSDQGDGPAVVLLHGQPGQGHDWSAVTAQLLFGGARVIVPDRFGYGATGGTAMGIAANADAVAAILDQRHLERATMVGHSWAGAVALDLAQRHPGKVQALVLVASVGGPGSVSGLDRALATAVLGPALSLAGLMALHTGAGRRLLEPVSQPTKSAVVGTPATGWQRIWRSFVIEQRALLAELPGIVELLGSVHAPTAVVIGDTDRVVPPISQEKLAAALARSEVVRVAGVGHLLPRHAPDRVAEVIVRLATGA